jgi:hypothetical protein
MKRRPELSPAFVTAIGRIRSPAISVIVIVCASTFVMLYARRKTKKARSVDKVNRT